MFNFGYFFSDDAMPDTPHILQVPGNSDSCDELFSDAHGCSAVVTKAFEGFKARKSRPVGLGDYIERGEDSLGVIRQITAWNADPENKPALLIRGNHEDMALGTLYFIDIINAIKMKDSEKPEIWDHFISQYPNQWLKTLNENILKRLEKNGNVLFAIVEKYKKGELNEDERNSKLDNFIKEQIKKDFPGKGLINMRKFFSHTCIAIKNGSDWVFASTVEECAEVKDFIERLPYMIRVAAVIRDGKVIVPGYDIVHAAPLSEADIQAALRNPIPRFTSEQICYLTWARNTLNIKEGSQLINANGRTSDSTVTYAGHNILSASAPDYQSINVLVIDTATVLTDCMFIINHTNKTILVVQKQEGLLPLGIFPSLKALHKLQGSDQSAKEIHDEISQKAFLSFKDHRNVAYTQFSAIDEEEMPYFKEVFLEEVEKVLKTDEEAMPLKDSERIDVARYLLEYEKHPLAKISNEARYSVQTRSILKAETLLLKKVTSSLVECQGSWFKGTKITFYNHASDNNTEQNAKQYTLKGRG